MPRNKGCIAHTQIHTEVYLLPVECLSLKVFTAGFVWLCLGICPLHELKTPSTERLFAGSRIRSKLLGDIFANIVTLCEQRLQGVYIKPLICVLMIGMQETVSKSVVFCLLSGWSPKTHFAQTIYKRVLCRWPRKHNESFTTRLWGKIWMGLFHNGR
jgi:hypothetical protein